MEIDQKVTIFFSFMIYAALAVWTPLGEKLFDFVDKFIDRKNSILRWCGIIVGLFIGYLPFIVMLYLIHY